GGEPVLIKVARGRAKPVKPVSFIVASRGLYSTPVPPSGHAVDRDTVAEMARPACVVEDDRLEVVEQGRTRAVRLIADTGLNEGIGPVAMPGPVSAPCADRRHNTSTAVREN